MVLFILAIMLGIALLVWLWKIPIQTMVAAMKKSGSSAAEAYIVVGLLGTASALAIYMITKIV